MSLIDKDQEFLHTQMDIALLEAARALTKAAACAKSASDTNYDIGQAMSYIDSARRRNQR